MKQKKPLSSYVEMLRTMIAILISLIIVFAIILLISSQPLSALGDFIFGPLTSVRRFGNVIEGMTPLMFTGLAVIILFKPGLFNLSMEGAFFIGAVAACAASLGLGLSGKTALIVAMAAAAVAGGFICFIPGIRIPAWIVIVIISREFIISGFRLIAADNGVVIAASYWGKFKTASQMVTVILLVLNIQNTVFTVLGTVFIYISLVLTVVSLIDYIAKNKEVLKDQN